jgi:hypothetical protein
MRNLFMVFFKNSRELSTQEYPVEECKITAIGDVHNFFLNTKLIEQLTTIELGSGAHILKIGEKKTIQIHFCNSIGIEGFNALKDMHLKNSQIVLVFPKNEEEAKKHLNPAKQDDSVYLVILLDKNISANKSYTIYDKNLNNLISSCEITSLNDFFRSVWNTYDNLKNQHSNHSQYVSNN